MGKIIYKILFWVLLYIMDIKRMCAACFSSWFSSTTTTTAKIKTMDKNSIRNLILLCRFCRTSYQNSDESLRFEFIFPTMFPCSHKWWKLRVSAHSFFLIFLIFICCLLAELGLVFMYLVYILMYEYINIIHNASDIICICTISLLRICHFLFDVWFCFCKFCFNFCLKHRILPH